MSVCCGWFSGAFVSVLQNKKKVEEERGIQRRRENTEIID